MFIPDPRSKNSKKRGMKKVCCPTLFCGHKHHKIENYLIFELTKNKFWANLERIIELFTQKLSLSPQK
jgi:hypothetical protein